MIPLPEAHRQGEGPTVVAIRRVFSNGGLVARGRYIPWRTSLRRLRRVATVSVTFIVAASCAATSGPSSLRGQKLEVAAVWSGTEQARFQQVLRAFQQRTGVVVTYTSASDGVPTFLQHRLAAGHPPDVALLPQPGLLRQLVDRKAVVPLDGLIGAEIKRNYGPIWQELGSVDGRLFAVWFKAANKSLIWYNIGVFERAGVVPPQNLQGLLSVAGAVTRSGVPAFAVGGADGWTLTDWFANLYLRLAGPARYDFLASHQIPWTDPSVKDALRLLSSVLAPGLMAGGTAGALRTSFNDSVIQVFADPPAAGMVFEGDFVAGAVTGMTKAELGVDADAFAFPSLGQSAPVVMGGGDAAVLMRRSVAGVALMRFLAEPQSGSIWAARGGFVSPNLNVDLGVYPDELSRSIARSVLDAGDDFRFGMSDLQPTAFGGVEGQGLRKELQDFLTSRDVDTTASRLEAEAKAAFGH
jgi:alpha-glucoside transport system substrate-binding protein